MNICLTKEIYGRHNLINYFTWLPINGDSNETKRETRSSKNRKNEKSRIVPKANWKANLSFTYSSKHNLSN